MTTDQENDLICEKLLGLRKHCAHADCPDWRTAEGKRIWGTLSFTTWAEAGLILDALSAAGRKTVVGDKSISGGWWCTADAVCTLRNTGPLAVRAAALEYIRKLP